MKTIRTQSATAVLTAMLCLCTITAADTPHHDAFTYQGQLKLNGEPVAGPVDMAFRLHNAAEYGDPVSDLIVADGFDEFDEDGRFTIDLEFGAEVFDGTPIWLEITVDGTALAPRQPIMPTPYSVRSLNVATVSNAALGGTYSNALNLSNPANIIKGAFIGSGSGLMNLNANRISHGTLGDDRLSGTYSNTLHMTNVNNIFAGTFSGDFIGSGADLMNLNADNITAGNLNAAHLSTGGEWNLTSNLNINNGSLFINQSNGRVGIGTSSPLARLHVNEPSNGPGVILPGLRTTVTDTSPNVIGGNAANDVGAGVSGGTIGGGGQTANQNRVLADFGTVGGGRSNTAEGNSATVAGGEINIADGSLSVIGGGASNTASGNFSTIGGGRVNAASSLDSTIGGGAQNTASGIESVIAGGSQNVASAFRSTVSGGFSNTADGQLATVGGGQANVAVDFATVAGGLQNQANGTSSAIGGGLGNTASGLRSTIPGGFSNSAAGAYSLAAGQFANANHDGTFVWSDGTLFDFGSTNVNQFLIYAEGGVGINTNNPGGFALAVNGFAAKTGGGPWADFSDARLKYDIEPLNGSLERLLLLNGYSFNYHQRAIEKNFALPGRQVGLIAQEVVEVFPDWVDEDPDGYMFITPRGTTALFVEALRELREEKDAEIDALHERIERLEAIIGSLLDEKEIAR